MASYRVDITRSVEKELESLAVKDHTRVVTRMRALADDPRPHGCEKLSGEEKYRIRQGDLRVIYAVEDQTLVVTVVKIGHRREVYR